MKEPYTALLHEEERFKDYFVVNWMLGNTCNYACSYCPSYLHDGSSPWTSLHSVLDFSEKIIHHITDRKIYFEFTGGEITMWKHLPAAAAFLKEKGAFVGLISNGSRTARWWSENKKNLDSVCLSFHTEFANGEHFLEIIHILKEAVKLHINIMVFPDLFYSSVEFAKMLEEIEGISISMQPIIEGLRTDVYPYNAEMRAEMDNLNRGFSKKPSKPVFRGRMLKVSGNGESTVTEGAELIRNGENHWEGWVCYAGIEQIVIDNSGTIYRGWCKAGGIIGNIHYPFFSLPTIPVRCRQQSCHCNFDITSTKHK